MSMQEKSGLPPVDQYSRGAFGQGLDELSSAGVPYEPPSAERHADPDWQLFYAAATAKEREIITNLDRMYAIAMQLALGDKSKIELEHRAKEVIPQLNEARKDVEETVLKFGDGAPEWFLASGRALIESMDEIVKFFNLPSSVERLHELIGGIAEAYSRFKEQAFRLSSPDRFQKI